MPPAPCVPTLVIVAVSRPVAVADVDRVAGSEAGDALDLDVGGAARAVAEKTVAGAVVGWVASGIAVMTRLKVRRANAGDDLADREARRGVDRDVGDVRLGAVARRLGVAETGVREVGDEVLVLRPEQLVRAVASSATPYLPYVSSIQ